MLYKREATADENASLNTFMRERFGESYIGSTWVVWMENGDKIWYASLNELGLPSVDSIIQYADGTREEGLQWEAAEAYGEGAGLVSLDNGRTFREAEDLSDEEVARVLEDIEARDPKFWPEFAALCEDIGPTDTKREFLEQFMWRLCLPYVIG